jgi:indole-3-glycerol phosphate synthase
MHNHLEKILARKKEEVKNLHLKGNKLSVIAEIKRASPSRGDLAPIADPVLLARQYRAGGAAMLSVLTDEAFSGSLNDLHTVSQALPGCPILRKDFIVDLRQLQESKRYGATAVLLIVAVLGEETALFLKEAESLGLDVLVEVHDEEELQIALNAGARMIGVNNRNLSTFEVDLAIAERLAPLIPSHLIKVAESGIHTPEDAQRMRRAGYDAILVGEALVRSENPKHLIEELRS